MLLHVYPLNFRIAVIEIVHFFGFFSFSFLNLTLCSSIIGVSFLVSDKNGFIQYCFGIIMQGDHGSYTGDLLAEFEDALLEQRLNCVSGVGLKVSRESRFQSYIQHRLAELEGD
jgi:hypothetical protein